ncbi:MAG TPA: flavodoxin family protein [Acidimicrobiales bacterium]|nr:flavodoxin family protein [Acidimicrobiales bacterium]
MNAVVISESLTGNTRRAADLIAAELTAKGARAVACPITAIDYQALSAADVVIVGTWTDGVVFFGQRPGRAHRLRAMPSVSGKKAVVFCTYAVDPGRTLDKLSEIVQARGGDVIGGMAIRRTNLAGGAAELVQRLLDVIEGEPAASS